MVLGLLGCFMIRDRSRIAETRRVFTEQTRPTASPSRPARAKPAPRVPRPWYQRQVRREPAPRPVVLVPENVSMG